MVFGIGSRSEQEKGKEHDNFMQLFFLPAFRPILWMRPLSLPLAGGGGLHGEGREGGGKRERKRTDLKLKRGTRGQRTHTDTAPVGLWSEALRGGRVPPVKLLFSCLYFGLCK